MAINAYINANDPNHFPRSEFFRKSEKFYDFDSSVLNVANQSTLMNNHPNL